MPTLQPDAIDTIFLAARTHSFFLPKEVPDSLLHEIWDVARMGPTSANTNPLRIAFVRSAEAKERLKPALMGANVEKTMSAPVTAIFAYDIEFYEHLPKLFPHRDMRGYFAGNAQVALEFAKTNSTLQAAYFMIAARAAGLDCGAMGGFDAEKTNQTFFEGTSWRALFLCNLGYGDATKLFPRNPRLEFAEISKVL